MTKYQRRVVREKKQLDEKRERLNTFIGSEQFNTVRPIEQLRLTLQYKVMSIYSDLLGERIKDFSDPPRHVLD
jgi:hypothetical protein